MDQTSEEKSYFSKDEESQEELLLFLINAMKEAFHLEKLESLVNVLQGKVIKDLLCEIEPLFENVSGSLALNLDDDSSDVRYSNLLILLTALKKFFDYKVKAENIKLFEAFNIDALLDVKELARGTTKDLHTFCRILLLMGAVSSQKKTFLTKFDDYDEVYLKEFLEIVDSFMNIEEESIPSLSPELAQEKRRFTTRSSILIGCQDTLINRMFDHLRQKLEDLEENKISLEKEIKIRDQERAALECNMNELVLKCHAIEQKEEEYKDEIGHYKDELKKQQDQLAKDSNSHSVKETFLTTALHEKEQELALLKENFSFLHGIQRQEVIDLEAKIAELKKANEEQLIVKEENETLKKKFSVIDPGIPKELEMLRKEKSEYLEVITSLKSEKNKLMGRISEIQNSLKSEAEQNNSLNQTIYDLEKQIQNYKRASVTATPIPQDFTFNVEEIPSPRARAKTEIHRKADANIMQLDDNRKISLLDCFQDEYAAENKVIISSQLQEELQKSEERLAMTLNELTIVQQEKERLSKTIQEKEATVSNEVAALKDIVEEREKTIEKLIETKKQSEAQLEIEMHKENQNLIDSLSNLHKTLADLHNANQKLVTENENLLSQNQKIQSLLDNEKTRLNESLQSQENFAKELSTSLVEHNKMTAHLHKEIFRLNAACEKEQKTSRQKENEVEILKGQNEKLVEEVKNLTSLKMKNDKLLHEEQEKIKDKEDKIKELNQTIHVSKMFPRKMSRKEDSPTQRKIGLKIGCKISNDGTSTQRGSLSISKNENNPSELIVSSSKTQKSFESTQLCDNKLEYEILKRDEEIKILTLKVKDLITENKKNVGQIHENLRKYNAEIAQRDEDMQFMRSAYENLKVHSKGEYDYIASSLYEMALQFTKIKSELLNK